MGMMFSERSRRICKSFTPKSTQVCAVPERGNQGQTQHKGTAAGTAYAALVARWRSRRGLLSSVDPDVHRVLPFLLLLKIDGKQCFTFFFSPFSPILLLKIDGKPCFTFFFSPFSPKLGFQNLTEARIARTLTATLLSHSLWA